MLVVPKFPTLSSFYTDREPRSRKTWFHASSIKPNEEHVDGVVRELHEETCLVLTLDDLTMLSDTPVRVALLEG
jgi:hypothetical protein